MPRLRRHASATKVSPANSLGYMDGGIDAAYLERFGAGLHLREHHHGELAVGVPR